MLILGRLRGGRPPAWDQGEAVPWPTQQQIREQREAARRERDGEPAEGGEGGRGRNGDQAGDGGKRVPRTPAPQPRRPDAAAGDPRADAAKRKRKRRS
jgi:hypothetical protein